MNEKYKRFERNCRYYFSRVLNIPLIGPKMFQISATHRCPLRCKMCEVFKNTLKAEDEISTEKLKDMIRQFKEFDGQEVFLVGGEPFIRDDFFEVVEYAVSLGLKTSASTSGVLINNETAEKIVNSPLTYYLLSLDGATAKTHDAFRGEHVFDKAINSLRLINEAKIKAGKSRDDPPFIIILSIVANSNLEELMKLIFLAERFNAIAIHFQPLQTDNTRMMEKETSNPLWVPKERLLLLDKIMDEIEENKRITRLWYISCDTNLIKKYFRCQVTSKDMKCYMDLIRACVKPDGTLSTCMDYLGNVHLSNLKELWKSEKSRAVRRFSHNCPSLCLQRCIYLDEASSLKILSGELLVSEPQEDVEYLRKSYNLLIRYETLILAFRYHILFSLKFKEGGYKNEDLINIDWELGELKKIKDGFKEKIYGK